MKHTKYDMNRCIELLLLPASNSIDLFLKKARVSIIHVKSIFFLSMVPEVAVIMLLVVYAGEKNPYQVQNNLLSVGVL